MPGGGGGGGLLGIRVSGGVALPVGGRPAGRDARTPRGGCAGERYRTVQRRGVRRQGDDGSRLRRAAVRRERGGLRECRAAAAGRWILRWGRRTARAGGRRSSLGHR